MKNVQKNAYTVKLMKTFFSTVDCVSNHITSMCDTKYLGERILILLSFAQKLKLKQAEECQVYFDP